MRSNFFLAGLVTLLIRGAIYMKPLKLTINGGMRLAVSRY